MSLTLDELESHLFKCADIIRDAVDSTDYKDYILPLVYYKTISDNFEVQFEQYVEEYGEEYARRPNLYDVPNVPEDYTWDGLRSVNENVDEAINDAFDALREANDGEVEGFSKSGGWVIIAPPCRPNRT